MLVGHSTLVHSYTTTLRSTQLHSSRELEWGVGVGVFRVGRALLRYAIFLLVTYKFCRYVRTNAMHKKKRICLGKSTGMRPVYPVRYPYHTCMFNVK